MAKRESISKNTRFEVFKRDKFTCQYCGSKSPDVVLNIDHIQAVARGGGSEILNLITSCFACNNGKRDKALDDSSVVEKQRKQLEQLQERREQIELMLEWKKSLNMLDNDVIEMIAGYINSKMEPLTLSESGKKNIKKWLKTSDTETILDSVDISAEKYLRFMENEVDKDSADLFINKIGGIIAVNKMPPIQQKISYIKGIARNRFSYWNDQSGSIVINNYVKSLKVHWNDQEILEDLEIEVIKITKESDNWTQWKATLEKWTEDIEKWDKPKPVIKQINEKELSMESLRGIVLERIQLQLDSLKAVDYVAKIFPNYEKEEFQECFFKISLEFLEVNIELDGLPKDEIESEDFIDSFLQSSKLSKFLDFDYSIETENIDILSRLDTYVYKLLTESFMYNYYNSLYCREEYKPIMAKIHFDELRNEALSRE